MLHKNIQRYPTLYEGVFERANSLNFLRLILASCVIFSHTPYLVMGAKVDEHPLVHNFYVFGDYAVNAFFCISGFLIAHSAYRSGAGSYLVKRVLRIFPGYWVSILFVVALGGPISVITGHAATGWDWADALHYIRSNYDLMALQYPLFGGPIDVPLEFPSWNGSVWSLEYEFFCYLLLLPLFYLPLIPGVRLYEPSLRASPARPQRFGAYVPAFLCGFPTLSAEPQNQGLPGAVGSVRCSRSVHHLAGTACECFAVGPAYSRLRNHWFRMLHQHFMGAHQ